MSVVTGRDREIFPGKSEVFFDPILSDIRVCTVD